MVHSKNIQQLSGSPYKLTLNSFVILIFIVVLLVDSLLSDVSQIVNQKLPDSTRMALFSVLAALAIIFGTKVTLQDTARIRTQLYSRNNALASLSRMISVLHFIIAGMLILMTLQIIFASEYLTGFAIALIAVGWLIGTVVLGIMSFKLVQWYKARRSLIVLLYFASSVIMCGVLATLAVPNFLIMAQTSPYYVNSQSVEVKTFQANPQTLDTLFAIASIGNWFVPPLGFVVWAATAIMLRRYSNTLGRGKYWIILSAPLVCMIIGVTALLVLLPTVNTVFDQQVIFYTMLIFGGMIASGFLLGFAFRVISKNMQKDAQGKIRDYLDISSRGLAILFVCFFSNPSAGSYLPFGVISASFLAFGAYLFFSGIYSSAIFISSDATLRQIIRKSLLDQSRLLDNIGLANMDRELENRTREMIRTHKEFMEKTGVDPAVSESDVRSYMQEIITEIKETGVDRPSERKGATEGDALPKETKNDAE